MAETTPDEGDLQFLDTLQDKMEERLARLVPVRGRFCGNCYGRLIGDHRPCPFCGSDPREAGTVEEIPQAVLRAYRARQRTEAAWVYGVGFVGLMLAGTLFLVLVLWGPGLLGHPATAFAVLIGGGYVLARALGEGVGGAIGMSLGTRKRNRLWLEHCIARSRPTEAGPQA
ncbi:MAG: hypothetical protein ACE5EF_07865 [Dehalococcoidia bacterium]